MVLVVNFIAVDDVKFFREQIKDVIIKFSIKADVEVKIFSFEEYNAEFKKTTKMNLQNKFYILDIETKKNNGIDAVRQIRKTDYENPIIFSSMYERRYGGELLRSNLKFDFVSKTEPIGFERALFSKIVYTYNEVIYLPKLTLDASNSLSNIQHL